MYVVCCVGCVSYVMFGLFLVFVMVTVYVCPSVYCVGSPVR